MLTPEITAKFDYDPKPLMRRQQKSMRRYLYSTGGYVRQIARRSLKRARKIRVSELPDDAREKYQEDMEDFRNGYRDRPPFLREIISAPGEPPLLHQSKSPLKYLLRFSADVEAATVVIGPERAKQGIVGELEKKRPFMTPAFKAVQPKLPQFLKESFS